MVLDADFVVLAGVITRNEAKNQAGEKQCEISIQRCGKHGLIPTKLTIIAANHFTEICS